MVRDYSPRKAVNKNRPKKQPVSLLIPIVAVAVVVSFGAGMLTGWLCLPPRRAPQALASRADQIGAPASVPGHNAAANAPMGQEPPLTFYETLPKGNSNTLMGSGLNPRKPGEAVPAKPAHNPSPAPQPQAASPAAPAAAKPATPSAPPAAAPAVPPETAKEAKKAPAKGGYTVQVASYRDRKEADAVVARSIQKGLAAYVVQLKTPDNGVWYRVRIGKNLDQQAASDLAARAGKGAVALPE